VGDEDVGQPELVLNVLQQVHHLGLYRYVQSGDRLIANDDLGIQGQSPGHTDPLALTAGELVRVPVDVVGVEPHQFQQLGYPAALLVLGHDAGMDRPRFADDIAHRHPRVERCIRILEDDLDVAAQLA